MICALLSYFLPKYDKLFQLGFVASFATKLSDTLASEIGKAFGKTTVLITTFERVPKGTEGAVSLEGLLAGVLGSLIIAILAKALNMIRVDAILYCAIAAFLANYVESLLGAVFQDKLKWLTNEFVNFINTSVGAIIAIILAILIKRIT